MDISYMAQYVQHGCDCLDFYPVESSAILEFTLGPTMILVHQAETKDSPATFYPTGIFEKVSYSEHAGFTSEWRKGSSRNKYQTIINLTEGHIDTERKTVTLKLVDSNLITGDSDERSVNMYEFSGEYVDGFWGSTGKAVLQTGKYAGDIVNTIRFAKMDFDLYLQ